MKISKAKLRQIIKEEFGASVLGSPQDNPPGGHLRFPEDRPERPPPKSWGDGHPPEEEAAADEAKEEEVTKASLVAELTKRARKWAATPAIQPSEVQVWIEYSDRLMNLAEQGNLSQNNITSHLDRVITQLEKSVGIKEQ